MFNVAQDPIFKGLAVAGKSNPQVEQAWLQGQKTSGAIYDTLPIPGAAAAGTQLQFFVNCGARTYPNQTNLTQNKLDDGFFQVIEAVKFEVFTQASAGAAITAANAIYQAATTIGIIGGAMSIQVNQGIVVNRIPMTNFLPEMNVNGFAANAVADTTGLVITKQGHSYYKLENPLVLLPQTPFQINVDLPIYTGAATLFLRCELQGLSVVPNPSKV